jgi:putative ABC transport system permease protein
MIFGAIGMIVLILACINYVSLSNAYSIDQFSKVGIRKILGASNREVVLQYLMEAWLLGVIAMMVSLVWIELSRSWFESIFGVKLTGLYTPSSLFMILAITSLAGILSGLYPSLILSSVKAIKITKGQFSKGSSGVNTQKVLVVLQYSITIVLIIGILVVRKQLNYVEEKDLGFTKENLLVLATNGSPEVIPGYEGFANDLIALPGVSGITRSNTGIGGGLDTSPALAETAEGKRINVKVFTARVDHNYIDTYKMSLIAGRNFIPGNAADSSRGYIINESAARAYGYTNPKDAIGKFFRIGRTDGEVLGVVRDFHYANLRQKIEPAALFLLNGYFSRITVSMDSHTDQNTTVMAITNAWRKHFPETVVDFSFLEDRLQGSYGSEHQFSKTFLIFSIISITIACLGLFAVVSYNVERRFKEIGIRKVLGATAGGI